jgi:hypothetical protein
MIEWIGAGNRMSWDGGTIAIEYGALIEDGKTIPHIEMRTEHVNVHAMRAGGTREYGDVKRR